MKFLINSEFAELESGNEKFRGSARSTNKLLDIANMIFNLSMN